MRKRLSVTGIIAALTYTLGLGFTVMRVVGINIEFSAFLLCAVIIFAVVIPIVAYKPCAVALAVLLTLGLILFFYNFKFYVQLAVHFAERIVLFFRDGIPLTRVDCIVLSCGILVPLSSASIIFAGRLNSALLLTVVAGAFFIAAWELGFPDVMNGLCACAVAIIIVFASSYSKKFVKSAVPAAVARRAALFVLPFALIAVLLCAKLIPADRAGSSVAAVEDIFDDIADAVAPIFGYSFRTRRDFTFSDYGYNSELGGPVRLRDTPVMAVTGASDYTLLRGSVKDEYTGHSWRDSSDSATYRFDAALQKAYRDTVFNLGIPEHPVPSYFMRSVKLEITLLGGSHVSPIFTAGRPTAISASNVERFIPYFDDQGELFSKYYLVRNTTYTVEDSMLHWASSSFPVAVAKLEEMVSDKKASGWNPDPQYEAILEKYTQLPTLSRNVTQTANDLTAGYDSPYKKASAIMEHLRSNYTYSLDVPYVPYGTEFVEWFMQTRVGYCTYFATAMTVFARAAGIPARYVEGFSMYNLMPDKNGTYTVTSAQAHAWCEVYLEGIGWVPFDATASGSSSVTPSSLPENNTENPVSEESEITEQPTEETTPSPAPTTNQTETAPDSPDEKKPFPWMAILLLVLAVAAATMAALKLLQMRFRTPRLLTKYISGECLMLCWRDINKMLKYWKLAPETGETCMALAERVGDMPFEACSFAQVAQLTELYIYGGIDPGAEELRTVIDFRREMDGALLKKLRPFRYIACRVSWLIS